MGFLSFLKRGPAEEPESAKQKSADVFTRIGETRGALMEGLNNPRLAWTKDITFLKEGRWSAFNNLDKSDPEASLDIGYECEQGRSPGVSATVGAGEHRHTIHFDAGELDKARTAVERLDHLAAGLDYVATASEYEESIDRVIDAIRQELRTSPRANRAGLERELGRWERFREKILADLDDRRNRRLTEHIGEYRRAGTYLMNIAKRAPVESNERGVFATDLRRDFIDNPQFAFLEKPAPKFREHPRDFPELDREQMSAYSDDDFFDLVGASPGERTEERMKQYQRMIPQVAESMLLQESADLFGILNGSWIPREPELPEAAKKELRNDLIRELRVQGWKILESEHATHLQKPGGDDQPVFTKAGNRYTTR